MALTRRSFKSALLFVLTLSVLPNTGCKFAQIIQMIMSAVGGGGGLPGFGGGGGGGSLLPGGLGGGGASGPLSPTSTLPPPPESTKKAQEIMAAYGVPVMGAQATPDKMDLIAYGLRHYKREHCQGLRQINVVNYEQEGLMGLWTSNGQGAQIFYYVHPHWSTPLSAHTVVHELGHHTTLFSREQWGNQLSAAIGTGANSYPSQYSKTSDAEKLAENTTFVLLGNNVEKRPLPNWALTVQAKQLYDQEFANRPPI